MINLAIPKTTAEELYTTIDLSIFERKPKSDIDLIENFLPSKLWRLNNLYTIVNKAGIRIPFQMNLSQHRVYSTKLIHPRIIILKSRQQGISTFWLISYLDDALFIPDLNIGLMAQGKSEASTLLKRIKLAWDCFPIEVKDFLGLSLDKDNSEEFAFSNGSSVFIRTSFRSATLQRLHISEFGKIAAKYPERARETKTGTLQTIAPGNDTVIESTAEGDNDFKTMWLGAEEVFPDLAPKDFYPLFLSWLDDPHCYSKKKQILSNEQDEYFRTLEATLDRKITQGQKNFWVMQYRELGNDIYQEYPATPEEAFMATRDGAYYGVQYRELIQKRNREREGLYDPNLLVNIAMDLGMNDDFVLVFFQRWRNEWRIIGEYQNSGEGIEHYVNYIANTGYKIGKVFGPHDLKVRDLSTGLTRLHRFRELGIRKIKALDRTPISEGIEAVRKLIPFIYIDKKCVYLIKCFKNYSKEWDDKLKVWKDKPLHNEYSHGADGIRNMAMSEVHRIVNSKGDQENLGKSNTNVVDGIAM